MKKSLVVALAVLGGIAAFAAEPNTWWVAKEDANASDELVTGRGTEALPFRTIQAALDNPGFVAGDNVFVKRGRYDEGERVTKVGSYSLTNRIVITQKVYLKAVEGREVTSIVGKWGSNATTGAGTGGIRCVYVDGGTGTVFENFTFDHGAALGSTSSGTSARHYNIGGGIFVQDLSHEVYAVDCKFFKCSASVGPAMRGGTAIRCIFDACRAYLGASAVLSATYAFACSATRCTQSTTTAAAKRYVLDADSVAVNCTFVGNTCRGITNDCGVAYNCVFVDNLVDAYEGSSTNDCFVSSEDGYKHVFATGFDDYRLLSASGAVGAGKTDHRQVLVDLGVPAAYLEKDLRGDLIDWSAGTLNAGAVQATAMPADSGAVGFASDTYVDGRLVGANQWICSEKYPVSYEIRPADTSKALMYWSRTAEGSSVYDVRPSVVYPTPDGTARAWLPLRTLKNAAYQLYTPQFAAVEIWVDANDGSDETGAGTEASPYKTLQYAVDKVAKTLTLIRVKPGDYNEGGKVYNGLKARVDMSIFGNNVDGNKGGWAVMLRAEEGPAVTTIWGEADTTSDGDASGCGPNAVRCVFGDSSSAKIQGFTLRDGHTRSASDAEADATAVTGAAAYGYYTRTNTMRQQMPLVDCVITNCTSAGSIVYYAFTQRCRVTGNTAVTAIYQAGFHAADLIVGNTCAAIIGNSEKSRSFFLTCVDNVSADGTTPVADWQDDGIPVVASIFVGGSVTTESSYDIGNVVWEQADTSKLSAKSAVTDPLFLDRTAGDYRPGDVPPVVDSVDPRDYPAVTEYAHLDFNGDPLRVSADGRLTAGCIQANLPSAVVANVPDDRLGVNGVPGGSVCEVFAPGEEVKVEVTISETAGKERRTKGFTLNGVEHLFADYPGSETMTFGSSARLVIEPILSSDWYVDAVGGNDANNGFTPGTAKLTLADVMTNTAVTAGDTVNALPGAYDKGVMKAYASDVVWSRVVVPEDVTLRATGSVEETRIVGAAAPEPTDKKGYGLGTNAVRCVFLNSGSVLDGVTVTDGHADAVSSGASTYAKDGGVGGGVIGSGLVRNCLITNNFAYNGAGGGLATFVKCRIRNNKAVNRGGALWRSGNLEGCVISGNTCGGYTVMYPGSVYNCTFCDNGSASDVYYYGNNQVDGTYRVFNSVINRADGNNRKAIFWHCVINTNTINVGADKLNYEGVAGSVGVAGTAALLLDADYRPLPGCPAIDIGDAEKSSKYREADDLAGNPRILNGGMIDAGAFEYDWRVDYAKDLGRRIVVTDVSSNVVETADGKVEVPEGFLKLDWPSKGRPLVFNAQVEGEGTLTVFVNGEEFATLTATDEPQGFRVADPLAENEFEFVFTGSGSATLADFRRESGALLLVR